MPKYSIISENDIFGIDHNGKDCWEDIGGPDYEVVFGAYDDNACYHLFDSEDEARLKIKQLRDGGFKNELTVWEMEEILCYKFGDELSEM